MRTGYGKKQKTARVEDYAIQLRQPQAQFLLPQRLPAMSLLITKPDFWTNNRASKRPDRLETPERLTHLHQLTLNP
ncbi:hypothetical protein T265_16368, partial [Opisthorchis viverrini]